MSHRFKVLFNWTYFKQPTSREADVRFPLMERRDLRRCPRRSRRRVVVSDEQEVVGHQHGGADVLQRQDICAVERDHHSAAARMRRLWLGRSSEKEVGLCHCRGVADSNEEDRLSGITINGDKRVGSDIGDGDPDGKIAARYSERGNVEEVLAARRIGVETKYSVIAKQSSGRAPMRDRQAQPSPPAIAQRFATQQNRGARQVI